MTFNTCLMDPPWLERGAGKIKRGADRHYELLDRNEIFQVVYTSEEWKTVGPDAHLYMWCTNSFLEDGLWLMHELDFRYITNICWLKVTNSWPKIMKTLTLGGDLVLSEETWLAVLKGAVRIGMGQYFRGSHEICLFGTRGRCQKPKKALPGAFMAPRGEHSRKPQYIYELIERTSPGPFVEFFARPTIPRRGWAYHGNQVPKEF